MVLEMYTGNHPWPDMDNGWAAIFAIARTQSGPPLPSNISDTARDFLQRTFEPEPQNRPTCTQLLQHPFVNE